MTDAEIMNAMCRLRDVRAGLVMDTPECRLILADALRIQLRLGRHYMRILEMREKAKSAFVAGWPKVCP